MEQIKRELELATLPEMPKRLDYRIGIIGAGFIVRNCHLEAYRKAGFQSGGHHIAGPGTEQRSSCAAQDREGISGLEAAGR